MPEPLLTHAPLLATIALLLVVQLLARRAVQSLISLGGWGAVPLLTGWLGVPVHELSHAAVCVVLRRRVLEVRLFAPNPATGTLGYVSWQPGQGPVAWLAPLLVGLAPLLGSALTLQGLLWLGSASLHASPVADVDAAPWQHWTTGLLHSAEDAASMTRALWHAGGWSRAGAVALWWAAASVAAHSVPSRQDMQGAWKGLLVVVALVGLGWGACHLAHVDAAARLAAASLAVASTTAPALALAAVALTGLWAVTALLGRLRA